MKINKNVAISESGFLFNPLTGDFYTLNPFGIEMLQMLKEDNTFDQILNQVISKYNVDEKTFERDYLEFTGLLKQFSLVDSEN